MASTTKKDNHTTAATTQPKMYVYDLTGIGNRTPEYHPTKVVTKKPSSKGYIWGFTKSLKPSTKTKTCEIDPKQGENRGSEEVKKSSVFGTGRKSVSNVDEYIVKEEQPRRASVTITINESKPVKLIEGRKSVSHVEKTYEVDSKQGKTRGNEEVNKSSVLGGGRKSVSDMKEYIVKEEEPRRASVTTSFEETKPLKFIEGRKSMSNVEKQGRVRNSFAIEAELMQVKVLVSDMPGFMQLHAFRCARKTFDSLETFSAKHLAFNLKKEFDKVYGPAWHCIVGSSFGSFVTHSTGCFLYFALEKLYILLFKTKVRKTLE